MFAAFLVQNFTQYGFGLARAPQEVTDTLREGIVGGLERGETHPECDVDIIGGPGCLLIDRPDLTDWVSKISHLVVIIAAFSVD